ncbi:hypothetical protein GCM10011450_09110 [Advenella faeciporci]|uniref:Uncharacterized protein n=1 Tax=Advenella faeciporci TaxID=797535 RepID=A0A918JJB1_9BURK|nr:hypothetical protein GCM10011450_09110 [Advenella faeciporci]
MAITNIQDYCPANGIDQFISSESALNIPAEMVHYGVSKAALQGVSRGLVESIA